MIVYVDIVFLENLIINYVILLSTGIISRNIIKHFEIFLASIIGALYAILNYILPMNILENFIFKIILSILIIKIAFPGLEIKKYFISLIMFYLTSLTFGGATFMFMFLVDSNNVIYKNGSFIGMNSTEIMIFGCLFGFFIIFTVSRILKNKFNFLNLLCEMEIFYNGKCQKLKTLIDTGNFLKEPITNQDVIIVEKVYLKNIIEEKMWGEIKNIISGKYLGKLNDEVYKYHFKVIPFTSLGNENGLLIAFKPDYIKLYSCNGEIVKNNVFIGIYDGKLSRKNNYSSLVGISVFEEGRVDEYSTIS